MPRAGLDAAVVVAGAAQLADEVGLPHLTMALLADRLGVRAPSLYKHIDGQADLDRRIAALALTELGDALRDALQGRAGRDALSDAARTMRSFVIEHPGRYAATIRVDAGGPDDQLVAAGARVIGSLSAVLDRIPDRARRPHPCAARPAEPRPRLRGARVSGRLPAGHRRRRQLRVAGRLPGPRHPQPDRLSPDHSTGSSASMPRSRDGPRQGHPEPDRRPSATTARLDYPARKSSMAEERAARSGPSQ